MLWVTAEGVDQLIGLDIDTLEELQRVAAPGRPRRVLAVGDELLVHGAQAFQVTAIGSDGSARGSVSTGPDPRSPALAAGQAYFTGAGEGYGANWSCNGCHADGLSDTLVWRVGPFPLYEATRPLFWLEGTTPLGWPGYGSSARNFAFEGGSTIGRQASSEQVAALTEYMTSLMPPPAANGLTARDGSHSAQGLRGKALYEGQAGCATCHPLPLATNRALFAEGITPGPSDVPTLVGAYRHNVWLQAGQARTLRDAVAAAAAWVGVSLSDEELDDVTRYVGELTGRDFFALATRPERNAVRAPVDRPIELTFSAPVFDDPDNLAAIRLVDANGVAVPVSIAADGRRVLLTPDAPLAFASDYAVEIDATFESFDERHAIAQRIEWTTARPPALSLDGDYEWTIHVPAFDIASGQWDFDNTLATTVTFEATATPGGAATVARYADGLYYDEHAVVDGDRVYFAAMPVPLRNSFVDARDMVGTPVDENGDGVADRIEGTLTLAGPGFAVLDVTFDHQRPDPDGCREGTDGGLEVSVDPEGPAGIEIGWSSSDDGLALYVTDPAATIPMGPGQVVTGGATYWALATASFPSGFGQPVSYGVVPDGAVDDGARHGAVFEELEEGNCYKVSVVTTGFAVGSRTLRWRSE